MRPTVMVGLAALAFALGVVGYLDLPDKQYDVVDAAYRALQLFAFGGAVEPPVPWPLQVARILAPVLVGYAAIAGILSIFRDQVQRWTIRTLFRDHVVVAGLGSAGARLALAFREAGVRVVALEVDPANRRLAGCRERGVRVLIGDASDPLQLWAARVDRARYLIAICGADGVNVDVAMAAASVARERTGVLNAFAHIDSPALWRTLKAQFLATADEPQFRLECFNIPITGAQLMLERHPPFGSSGDRVRVRAHPCVVGSGELAQHLVVHMASTWSMQRDTSDALPLTLAGPGAPEVAARLLDRYPELAKLLGLEVRSVELERLSAALVREGGPEVTTVYVALPSESETLAAALGLHGSREMQHVPVVAAVADRDGGVARVLRSESRLGSAPFTLFGALDEALSPVLVVRGVNELLARGKHEAYVRAERAKSFTAPRDNPSVVAWEELPESLRETNRRFADGIALALEEAGCAIVPAPLAQAAEEAFPLTDAQVEDLARHEHERWTRDLLRDGWRPTEGPKDADRRLHPLVVPWDGLGEEERQKDRDAIRAIPSLLGGLGFEIYRTGRAAPPERPTRLPRSQVD